MIEAGLEESLLMRLIWQGWRSWEIDNIPYCVLLLLGSLYANLYDDL